MKRKLNFELTIDTATFTCQMKVSYKSVMQVNHGKMIRQKGLTREDFDVGHSGRRERRDDGNSVTGLGSEKVSCERLNTRREAVKLQSCNCDCILFAFGCLSIPK